MIYYLRTKDDALEILEKFNYFHDALLKRLELRSYDYFNSEKNHVCFGVFDVSIEFSHCNYNDGKPPFNQIIRAHFVDIKNLSLIFDEIKPADWTVNSVEIEEAKRANIKNEFESCFIMKINFNFYDKINNRWINLKKTLFSFKEARFEELTDNQYTESI